MDEFADVIERMIEEGVVDISDDGRLKPRLKLGRRIWYFMNYRHAKKMGCELWMNIMFKVFKVLPYRCLSCWKVILRPRYLRQMLEIADWIEENTDWYGKFGYDTREHTFGRYGIYLYNNSLDDAREKYEELRDVVDEIFMSRTLEWLNEGLPVVPMHVSEDNMWIQRGCTEMNMEFGDSAKWDELLSGEDLEMQKKIAGLFDISDVREYRDELNYVALRFIIKQAYADGDPTAKYMLDYPKVRKW